MNVAVIGAGAMGTALALILDKAGSEVTICPTEFDGPFVDAIEADRTHPSIGAAVPPDIGLVAPDGWDPVLAEADIAVVAVASVGLRDTVKLAGGSLKEGAIWAVATKGWDPTTAQPLSKVLADESPDHPAVIVVGPSLAKELAGGTPTGLVCASSDLDAARKVAEALNAPTVKTYVTDDVTGVEIGAAMKNVLAIAIGMAEGISEATGKPMTNTRAALFSRGLVEMSQLAVALGGRQATVLGLAGAGDLFVTVLGGRNGRFGRLVGTGLTPEKAFDEMGTTVEGYDNVKEAKSLAEANDLDLQVVKMAYSVLYEGVEPQDGIEGLMLGPPEDEI